MASPLDPPEAGGPLAPTRWDSLTFSQRRAVEFVLQRDREFGCAVRDAADGDYDFALWLLAAGNAFADIVEAFPYDLTDRVWRSCYRSRLSPAIAAKVALNGWLHLTPTARIVEGELMCPVCSSTGRIIEVDVATRGNDLTVSDGLIFAGTGDINFDHDRTVCERCASTVRLPQRVEDYS